MAFYYFFGVILLKVEEEIQLLLLEGHPPSFIAEFLYEKLSGDDQQLDETNLHALLYFLFKAGRYDLALYYFQKQTSNSNFHWHRGYLIYALIKAYPVIDEDLREIIMSALSIKEDEFPIVEAAITRIADKEFPEIKKHRKRQKELFAKRYQKKRADLIQKFIVFQTQQLVEPARKIIKKLDKTFPNDPEIKALAHSYNQVDAQAIFDKYKFKDKSVIKKPVNDPDVELAKQSFEKNLLEDAAKHRENYADLVVMCLFMECYETALLIIRPFQNELPTVWLFIEVLLKNNRFLEVLNILPILEKALSNNPDTFLATTYYRAICYWNLGERNNALVVLESLIGVRPNYRASEVLIEEWKKL